MKKLFLTASTILLMLVSVFVNAQKVGPNHSFGNQTINVSGTNYVIASFFVVNDQASPFDFSKIVLTTSGPIPKGITNIRIVDSVLNVSAKQIWSSLSPSTRMEVTPYSLVIAEGGVHIFYVFVDYSDTTKTTANSTDTLTFSVQILGQVGGRPFSSPVVRLQTLTVESSNSGIDVENRIGNDIVIYPNPAHNFFNIVTDIPIAGFNLSDMTGQTLLEQRSVGLNNAPGPIDISDLKPGIYFLRVIKGGDIYIQRVVKE